MLSNKIDFAIVITAEMCNPNGDPLNGKRPRIDYEGHGIMTNVCINRKIRNRLQDMGEKILIVQNNRTYDGFPSVKDRVDNSDFVKSLDRGDRDYVPKFIKGACGEWIDVRSFGQVFAYKGKDKSQNVSVGIRGPVSVGTARSLDCVDIIDLQITKSINNTTDSDAADIYDKDESTIGMQYVVSRGVYVAYGSIFPQMSELTGFSDEDADKIKYSMSTIFENDASSMRPSGSMTSALYWWTHNSKNGCASPAVVHRSLNIKQEDAFPYFSCTPDDVKGVKLDVLGDFAL